MSDTVQYSQLLYDAIALNNSIIAEHNFDEFEKEINDIYLHTLAVGIDTFTTGQWDTIAYIAHRCPYTDGLGVYNARNLYAIYADSEYISDDTACIGGYGRMQNNLAQNSEGKVTLYPNPADNNFIISYSGFSDAHFILTDILGRGVGKPIRLADYSTSYRFDSDELSAGIYIWKVTDCTGQVKIGRVIISH